MEEFDQPYLLNQVNNVSGIRKVIMLLGRESNGFEHTSILEKFHSNKERNIDEKLEFLRVLGMTEKKHDKICLAKDLLKTVSDIYTIIEKKRGKLDTDTLQRYIDYKLNFEIIKNLANISFKMEPTSKYVFYKQAAILLVYSFMEISQDTKYGLKRSQKTVNDVNTYFNNIGYKPESSRGKLIEMNDNKLRNALEILKDLELCEEVKHGRDKYYFSKLNPYYIMYLLRPLISKYSKTETKGMPLKNLIDTIAKKFLPITQQDDKYQAFITKSMGSALWLLYSRDHINLLNRGDFPIVSPKPTFIKAKFGDKVNWIEIINRGDKNE